MIDRPYTPQMPSPGAMDAFTVWLRRDLQQQFGRVEPVPEDMLAWIDVAFTPD